MINKIRHTGIVVDNLEDSLDFYVTRLGFSVSKRMDEQGNFIGKILGLENVLVTTVKMTLGEQMVELLDFVSHKATPERYTINSIGPTHLAFSVRDLGQVFEEFTSSGIEFISEPSISPDGFAKVAFCRAPEGTFIELVQVLGE